MRSSAVLSFLLFATCIACSETTSTPPPGGANPPENPIVGQKGATPPRPAPSADAPPPGPIPEGTALPTTCISNADPPAGTIAAYCVDFDAKTPRSLYPNTIASDDDYVYLATSGDALLRLSKAGGSVNRWMDGVAVGTRAEYTQRTLVLHGGWVYWFTPTGAIMRAAKNGTTPSATVPGTGGTASIVFWNDTLVLRPWDAQARTAQLALLAPGASAATTVGDTFPADCAFPGLMNGRAFIACERSGVVDGHGRWVEDQTATDLASGGSTSFDTLVGPAIYRPYGNYMYFTAPRFVNGSLAGTRVGRLTPSGATESVAELPDVDAAGGLEAVTSHGLYLETFPSGGLSKIAIDPGAESLGAATAEPLAIALGGRLRLIDETGVYAVQEHQICRKFGPRDMEGGAPCIEGTNHYAITRDAP